VTGAFLALRGGSTPPPTGETAPADTSQPYYGSIIFNVWRAKTQEAFQNYQDYSDLKRIRDDIETVPPPIHVEVRDGQGVMVGQSNTYASGDKLILTGQPKSLVWKVEAGRPEEPVHLLREATAPDEALARDVLLMPE
jgi:hypothetical protein